MKLYRFFCLFALVVFFAVGCSAPYLQQDNGHWQSLFNGNNLDGWTVKHHPDDKDTTFFSVVDGCIEANSLHVDKHDYVWLLTNKEYQDFIFKFRFQAYRDSPGNSGIQIRSRYDDSAFWLDGPQIDIHPTGPWRCGMMWDETREVNRWIYPNIPKGEWVNESMAPGNLIFYYANEGNSWNEMEITAVGNKIKTVLNGITITDFEGEGILNDAIHKKYNVGERGFIALQIHRNDKLKIRFTDIWIKEIPEHSK